MNAAKPENAGPSERALVIGGGVAGITAALDLAAGGMSVDLVECGPFLGGSVARLEKLYPTDHCAFCPIWVEIGKCMSHPRITVHLRAHVDTLERSGRHYLARIDAAPAFVDAGRCVFCGRCREACLARKPASADPAARDAVRPVWAHASPPFFQIDPDACSRCGDCRSKCPTDAIDLSRAATSVRVRAGAVIWATGFKEADLTVLREFAFGSHPDIMRAMEFEAWAGEQGPCMGQVKRPSDRKIPSSIAFVQCVGARDRRFLPYCASVCCMHAVKQAKWVRKRTPEVACTIFMTDLRTAGKNCFDYARRAVERHGIEIIRSRPGLILPLAERRQIAVKYEDTVDRQRRIRAFDMVVLNGGLETGACLPGGFEARLPAEARLSGPASNLSENERACGFCGGPADMADSVINASAAASDAMVFRGVTT